MAMVCGFTTRDEAATHLEQGIQEGWLSPDAFVRSQAVREVKKKDLTQEIRQGLLS
jgi:hypothetical protein